MKLFVLLALLFSTQAHASVTCQGGVDDDGDKNDQVVTVDSLTNPSSITIYFPSGRDPKTITGTCSFEVNHPDVVHCSAPAGDRTFDVAILTSRQPVVARLSLDQIDGWSDLPCR